MKYETVRLIDPTGNLIGVAQVADEGRHYGGTIDLSPAPPEVRQLFDEFDECVNGQMFSFLDAIETRIAALGVCGTFADGRQAPLYDLQICPSTGDIAFKVAVGSAGAPAALPKSHEVTPQRHPYAQGG